MSSPSGVIMLHTLAQWIIKIIYVQVAIYSVFWWRFERIPGTIDVLEPDNSFNAAAP